MQYLPSKKFLAVIVAVLLLSGGWFFASHSGNFGNNADFSGKFSYFPNLFKGNDKDSDNDGLKDWEETLWKTNPNNPDSDRDGISDGEEIKQGRDPIKPGPDDIFKTENQKANNSKTEGFSLTESLSRQFLAEYLSAKQAGNFDEKTKENLINSFLSNIQKEQLSNNNNSYTISDIKISNGNDNESKKTYGNVIGAIIQKYSNPAPEPELFVLERALDKQDERILYGLDKNINAYQGCVNDFLKMSAPSDMSQIHLDLINSFSEVKDSITDIKNVFQDPMVGILGIQQYQKSVDDMSFAIKRINAFFINKGINFNVNEPGYMIKQTSEKLI